MGEDRSAAGVLTALRAGRVFVSRDPSGPQLYLRSGAALPGSAIAPDAEVEVRVLGAGGGTLMLVSARGAEAAAVVEGDEWSRAFRLPADTPGYVRAQVLDERGEMLALANPLYLLR